MGYVVYGLGAVVILVAAVLGVRLLLRLALPALAKIHHPKNLRERVMVRYQGKNFDAWMFAWFKTGLDSMFRELPEFTRSMPAVHNFLDLGCGYGLASCLLLEIWNSATAYGIDPNPARVSGAAAAMGERGHGSVGAAPDFEQAIFPPAFEAAFALDMLHFLSDAQLSLTLNRLRARLSTGGFLVIRCPVWVESSPSLKMRLYQWFAKYKRSVISFRSIEQMRDKIREANFELSFSNLSGSNPELHWFIATASVSAADAGQIPLPPIAPSLI